MINYSEISIYMYLNITALNLYVPYLIAALFKFGRKF